MADRAFVFNQPEIQNLIKDKFIPLAMDDWYLRRQSDEVGVFYRNMTNQSARKDAGTATRQGRYAFTAQGKCLGYNNNRSPERILKMLAEALQEWDKLSKEERGATTALSTAAPDQSFERKAPAHGAILQVYTRPLQLVDGKYARCEAVAADAASEVAHQHSPTGFAAARDHLWLQSEEIQQLAKLVEAGKLAQVQDRLTKRILRFHLVDNTRGEPPAWSPEEIQTANLQLISAKDEIGRLGGEFSAKTANGQRGTAGKFEGEIVFERGKLTKLRLLAIGEHWGEAEHTKGSRPGRLPMGWSFQLIAKPSPADEIAPQFSRYLKGYYKAELAD